MDARLYKRLKRIEEHLETLWITEKEFLYLDAHKKVLFAELYRSVDGKSVADKEAAAYASDDWRDFIRGLSEKEAQYNAEKRRYELLIKAYDAEHLTLKTEHPVINRQGA